MATGLPDPFVNTAPGAKAVEQGGFIKTPPATAQADPGSFTDVAAEPGSRLGPVLPPIVEAVAAFRFTNLDLEECLGVTAEEFTLRAGQVFIAAAQENTSENGVYIAANPAVRHPLFQLPGDFAARMVRVETGAHAGAYLGCPVPPEDMGDSIAFEVLPAPQVAADWRPV